MDFFERTASRYVRPREAAAFAAGTKRALLAIERGDSDAGRLLEDLGSGSFAVLRRRTWFVAGVFQSFLNSAHLYTDQARHAELCRTGRQCLRDSDLAGLRLAITELDTAQLGTCDDAMLEEPGNVGGTVVTRP
ncbi:MAG: hypothetical protein Q4F72_12155 [Desulfovibrionaceae bacterium]|nr:hypothetical protein [Desulfovibrionaceae bacterium]